MGALARLAQELDEGGEVALFVEDGAAVVAAVEDVVTEAAWGSACGAWHPALVPSRPSRIIYDVPFSFLTKEVFDHHDDSLDFTADYVMDLVGNRLEKRLDKGSNSSIDEFFTYAHDDNDRLLTETLDSLTGTDTTTTYSYGGTGNPATYQTGKTIQETATSTTLSTVGYSYNLDGRLAQAMTETYTGGVVVRRETVAYIYEDTGIRTKATHTVETGTPLTVESQTETTYLNDSHNPTGYSQVVEETVRDVATNTVTKRVVTTVGADVIAQATFMPSGPAGGETRVLLYDGHGSTRLLTDLAGLVLQVYAYDAYGIPVGFDPALALTTLLHDGEQLDMWVDMGYHRDRYYQAWVGLWDRMDRYAGDLHHPQSLHKTLFVHADPVNGIDPSGQITLGSLQVSLATHLQLAGTVLRAVNTARQVMDFVSTAVEIANLFTGGLPALVSEARQLAQQWAATLATGLVAPQTQRLLDSAFWVDAADVLALESGRIVAELLGQHSAELISKFAQLKAKPFRWVVYMPTPAENTLPNPTRWLPLPGFNAFTGVPLLLRFGGGSTKASGEDLGRLFGFGYVLDSEFKKLAGQDRQLFRMDYHDVHGAVSGNDILWQSRGTHYTFHFHVRP